MPCTGAISEFVGRRGMAPGVSAQVADARERSCAATTMLGERGA
jgi:hypothetical protein